MDKYEPIIGWLLVNNLIPDPRNSRTHSREQTKKLARSTKVFGFLIPILVDQNGNVLTGQVPVLTTKNSPFSKNRSVEDFVRVNLTGLLAQRRLIQYLTGSYLNLLSKHLIQSLGSSSIGCEFEFRIADLR